VFVLAPPLKPWRTVAAALKRVNGQGSCECCKKLKKIVDCSSSGRVSAELLAQSDEDERLQGGVPAALHFVALLGQRILCAIATRFAACGRPGGPT